MIIIWIGHNNYYLLLLLNLSCLYSPPLLSRHLLYRYVKLTEVSSKYILLFEECWVSSQKEKTSKIIFRFSFSFVLLVVS